MGKDAPRKDVDPADGLLDFDSEAPNTSVDTNEWDIGFNRNEPDAALDGSQPVVIKEPDSAVGRNDLEIVFNRQEQNITSDTGKLEIQRDAYVLPPHAPSVPSFVWHTSVPVGHKSARLKIGIALLMLGSIGAFAWSGRLLTGMRSDAGTSGAQIQDASQPTPTCAATGTDECLTTRA